MAQKKAYSRYFIILQEDENGHSLASDKLPSGYTKLETKNDKCKVSFYVQNLKTEKEPYHMVLICNKKDTKKLIKLGMLNIDEYGRAEVTYEFSANDLAGSKISVDMVGGAAIVKTLDLGVTSVMCGFASTEPVKDWKSYVVFEQRQEEVEKERNSEKAEKVELKDDQSNKAAVVEQKEEIKEEVSNKEEEIKEEISNKEEELKREISNKEEELKREVSNKEEELKEKVSNKKEENNVFDEYEQKIEQLRQESEAETDSKADDTGLEVKIPGEEKKVDSEGEILREPEEKTLVKGISEAAKENEVEEVVPEEGVIRQAEADSQEEEARKSHGQSKKNKDDEDCPKGTVGEFFKLVAEDFEEIKDVCKEIRRCRWYKVTVNNLDEMCNSSNYNKYTIVYYPMVSYYPYIRRHGHYLLGYKYDSKGRMKYLVYGVPGTKSRTEQPYGGKSGFVTWIPLKEGDENENSFGYWLMFYDFRTSTIVIPAK